jgi:hypothetical protein
VRPATRATVLVVFVVIFAAPELLRPQNVADDQSCKAFVQKFYDWYWNRFADHANDPKFDTRKEPTYHEVARLHPAVLGPELIRLIKRDEMLSAKAQGIANLDFNPFLNTQDPEGKYLAGIATVSNGQCQVPIEHGHLTAELKKSGSTWVFTNFHYSFLSEDGKTKVAPDTDLVQILSQ